MTDRIRTSAPRRGDRPTTAPARMAEQGLSRRDNPYVGPRAFREGEKDVFFGRHREEEAIANSLLSSRVILLHSPSGAGKTSLIQAAVVPTFTERRFLIGATLQPRFTPLRVSLPPPLE